MWAFLNTVDHTKEKNVIKVEEKSAKNEKKNS